MEINLTSNDTILGVRGADHPVILYRDKDVPYTLSTDDEGVSRIDLTHEYMRFYRDYNIPYLELKHISRNALTYSFIPGDSLWGNKACAEDVKALRAASEACSAFLASSRKGRIQWRLEEKFQAYESDLRIPKRKTTTFQ